MAVASKRNRDDPASRTFPIPALGGFLLRQRNERMTRYFRAGVEGELISSDAEVVEGCRHTLVHPEERKRVAAPIACIRAGASRTAVLRLRILPTSSGLRSALRRLAACLAIAAATTVGCGDAPDATRPLGSLDAGVARVQVVWWDVSGAQRTRAFGTAFRVGSQGDLLTARHVAANARAERRRLGPQTRATIQVAFGPPGPEPGSDADGSLSVEVAITAEDRGVDLALLRILEPPAEGGQGRSAGGASRAGAARLASAPPPAEAAIAVAGYPIGERALVVRAGRLLDPVVLARALGQAQRLPTWLDQLLRDDVVLLADVETRLGNSGAPIYLAESGEIIGLCSAILFQDTLAKSELIPLPHPPGEPITVIIAAHRIQRFLDAQRVSAR